MTRKKKSRKKKKCNYRDPCTLTLLKRLFKTFEDRIEKKEYPDVEPIMAELKEYCDVETMEFVGKNLVAICERCLAFQELGIEVKRYIQSVKERT